jgi:hypothetical protein
LARVSHGLCGCGCGEPTLPAQTTDRRWGTVAGQPRRFVTGHSRKLNTPEWVEEDRGHETFCWVWQRAIRCNGYGAYFLNGKTHYAHRAVYEQLIGPVDASLTLDHLCRVRACVNPAHLEPVPVAVNIQRGACAKLTPDDVGAIRLRIAAGETQVAIARDYGVSGNAIHEIVHRKSWANLA